MRNPFPRIGLPLNGHLILNWPRMLENTGFRVFWVEELSLFSPSFAGCLDLKKEYRVESLLFLKPKFVGLVVCR